MQKRTREILALVLLAALLVAGIGFMAYYVLVGHNWNVAASNIDDSIGKMDGYTVILYEGTWQPDEADADEPETGVGPEDTPSGDEDDAEPETAEDMAGIYLEKGATVFIVDASDLARYREPFVVAKNGMRLGFMSVGNSELRSQVRADIRALEEQKVDYILAVTDDLALPGLCDEGVIEGISVAVVNGAEGASPDGQYAGSTYFVQAPRVGQVGALIISPSGVPSAKVVTRP